MFSIQQRFAFLFVIICLVILPKKKLDTHFESKNNFNNFLFYFQQNVACFGFPILHNTNNNTNNNAIFGGDGVLGLPIIGDAIKLFQRLPVVGFLLSGWKTNEQRTLISQSIEWGNGKARIGIWFKVSIRIQRQSREHDTWNWNGDSKFGVLVWERGERMNKPFESICNEINKVLFIKAEQSCKSFSPS